MVHMLPQTLHILYTLVHIFLIFSLRSLLLLTDYLLHA